MTVPSLIDYAQAAGETQSKPAPYLEIYERYFGHLRDRDVAILELGVADGKSMKMWRDCFPKGTIVGIDLFPPQIDEARVHIHQGAQDDRAFLPKVSQEHAPQGWDIIVDDAAHIGELAKISFWHLFKNHLKANGVYALEDWGTGYWGNHPYYPDGKYFSEQSDETLLHSLANRLIKNAPVEWPKLNLVQKLLRRYQYTRRFKSHEFGLPGFIKQLVDEIGRSDWTHPEYGVPPSRSSSVAHERSPFSSVLVTPGVTLITKAGA
ncbi:class I SAM-dependent methyltransferase [Bosea sp. NBC_00550]|uniref:class I SAM-dependent methyltransferase n=1 Tax=Bosea sp. NBC_00550 TaxID=2969621 RepID=UPI0022327528|nr:class I SAM-dependent methyltransferase [Bosea sp. NBC_00550]UZF91296.1 class I SAM-dependent methyltransferase [Bosea sp. NBC_00550]